MHSCAASLTAWNRLNASGGSCEGHTGAAGDKPGPWRRASWSSRGSALSASSDAMMARITFLRLATVASTNSRSDMVLPVMGRSATARGRVEDPTPCTRPAAWRQRCNHLPPSTLHPMRIGRGSRPPHRLVHRPAALRAVPDPPVTSLTVLRRGRRQRLVARVCPHWCKLECKPSARVPYPIGEMHLATNRCLHGAQAVAGSDLPERGNHPIRRRGRPNRCNRCDRYLRHPGRRTLHRPGADTLTVFRYSP
jgi:hypothetical protein